MFNKNCRGCNTAKDMHCFSNKQWEKEQSKCKECKRKRSSQTGSQTNMGRHTKKPRKDTGLPQEAGQTSSGMSRDANDGSRGDASPPVLTEERLDTILKGTNVTTELERFRQQINAALQSNPGDNNLISLHSVVLRMLQVTKQQDEQQRASAKDLQRVAELDEGLGIEMNYKVDLEMLEEELMDLFNWFENEDIRNEYMAPYKVLIQSSGMGKTKLLKELRDGVDRVGDVACKLLLCLPATVTPNVPKYFDGTLSIPLGQSKNSRDDICRNLNYCASNVQKDKLIILLDEAQLLLKDDGFMFRCIRWWLRRKDHTKRIVVLFTGTNSGLLNYFKEPVESVYSRDTNSKTSIYYDKGTKLYSPFFHVSTGALFRPLGANLSSDEDCKNALPYGRPLFQILNSGDGPTKSDEEKILQRLLTGYADNNWKNDERSWVSLFGSRFQLGLLPVSMVSDLVATGYANLVYCSPSHMEGTPSVAHTFPVDPVCARLSMCMMNANWNQGNIQGCSPATYTSQMKELYSLGRAVPERGDLGEVGAAMYLAFVADKLRGEHCRDFRQFRICLKAYAQQLFTLCKSSCMKKNQRKAKRSELRKKRRKELQKHNKENWSEGMIKSAAKIYATDKVRAFHVDKSTSTRFDGSVEVSFIQFVRSYYQLDTKAFCSEKSLAHLFASACALYTSPNRETFDIVGAIRYIDNSTTNGTYFGPLFVSVVTKGNFAFDMAYKEMTTAREKLLADGVQNGIFLLMLCGLQANSSYPKNWFFQSEDVAYSRNGLVVKLLLIPEKDEFGVKDFIQNSSIMCPEKFLMYASAPIGRMFFGEKQERVSRSKETTKPFSEYQGNMREGLKLAPPKLQFA